MNDLDQQVEQFLLHSPVLGERVFIAPGAVVMGHVTLGASSSVWYHAVLRGDINRIEVGHHSNIQDHCMLHLADDHPCLVGDYVTVGHRAILHACTVRSEVLVGMGAIILDGAVIGEQTIIGAGALVTQGQEIPAGSLVLGSPASVVRALSPQERARLKSWADKYVDLAAHYLRRGLAGSPSRADSERASGS